MAKLHSRVVALVVGAAGLAAVSTTASADGYERRAYAPAAAGCCSWNGFYVGINGGYAFSARDDDVFVFETVQTSPVTVQGSGSFGSLGIAGGFAGLQIGYNFTKCCSGWVFGIEADFQGGDISDSSTGRVANFVPSPPLGPVSATVDSTLRVGWFGTLRPRLGYAWGQTMLYATGGLAWAGVKHNLRFIDNSVPSGPLFMAQDTTSTSELGYVVGGGVEHMLSCCWSVKLEYQYIDLGSRSYTAPATTVTGLPANFRENTEVDTSFHTVRVGLNWKWDDRRDAPLK